MTAVQAHFFLAAAVVPRLKAGDDGHRVLEMCFGLDQHHANRMRACIQMVVVVVPAGLASHRVGYDRYKPGPRPHLHGKRLQIEAAP